MRPARRNSRWLIDVRGAGGKTTSEVVVTVPRNKDPARTDSTSANRIYRESSGVRNYHHSAAETNKKTGRGAECCLEPS